MPRSLYHIVKQYLSKNRRLRLHSKAVQVLACIVVFCTTYALILPAITLEKDLICTQQEHTHSDSCYEKQLTQEQLQLSCSYESLAVHVHSDACRSGTDLICGQADYIAHEHTAACTEGPVKCALPEVKLHTHTQQDCYEAQYAQIHSHTDVCYTRQRGDMTCTLTEGEGHTHDPDACYTLSETAQCGLEETQGHAHGAGCSEKKLVCTLTEQPHNHTDSCYTQLVCDLTEDGTHTHSDECSGKKLSCELTVEPHNHTDGCYETILVCTQEEVAAHAHSRQCYNPQLKCGLAEQGAHTHTDACYAWTETLVCGMEEGQGIGEPTYVLKCEKPEIKLHSHGESCYETYKDDEGNEHKRLICKELALSEHVHTDGCYTAVQIPAEDVDKLTCTLEATEGHTHGDGCYGEGNHLTCTRTEVPAHSHGTLCYGTWVLKCTETEHTHTDECRAEVPDYLCGLEEHTHDDACRNEEGYIICTVKLHTHSDSCLTAPVYHCGQDAHDHTGLCMADLSTLEEADSIAVTRVIRQIDAIPSADEIDAQLAAFEEAGNSGGAESWETEVYQQISDAYREYYFLGNALQPYVANSGKLLELEYIWSARPLITRIDSAAPTVGAYTSTSEFVELNIYDYNYNINEWWRANNKYPGFQWNGGAHSATEFRTPNADADAGVPNVITDRRRSDTVDFGNSMITNFSYTPKSGNAYGISDQVPLVANRGGAINVVSNANRPIGISTGNAVLSRQLIGGYPALADGTSLSYLFGNETADIYNAVTKKNTASIDGLFLKDPVTGTYSYNSRENHAYYSNNFFTRYNQILTPNFLLYPFGNFMPFNSISDASKATQVGAFNYGGGMKAYVDGIKADLTAANNAAGTGDWKYQSRKQLSVMLDEYAESYDIIPINGVKWSGISPANAIRDYFQMPGDNPSNDVSFVTQAHLDRMYNIDWDEDTNFFYGMEMKMLFMQPKDGYSGNDTNGDGKSDYPMEFYFTGDDDVWVYVDDVLFLDLSGIHRHVGGKIDFVNGLVFYYELDPATGDVSTTNYQWYSFAALFRAAGWTEAQIDEVLKPIQNNNRPFKDYTTHKFNFYYLERGSGSSVCRINFNFPLVKENSISVEKELSHTGDPNVETVGAPYFSFQIMKADADGTRTSEQFIGEGVKYNVYDAQSGSFLRSGTTEEYGIFKIKAGERAKFTGIAENAGKYYVREILDNDFYGQYDKIYVDGQAVTQVDDVWGIYKAPVSPVKDASDGSTVFTFDNRVKFEKLSYLTITKMVNGVDADVAKTLEYDMKVELNGVLTSANNGVQTDEDWIPIPVGTPYTLYQTESFIQHGQRVEIADNPHRVVTTEGIVTVPGGATAEIDYILPGTTFRVSETDDSAQGYTVGYGEFWGGKWMTAYSDRVEGTVPVYNVDNINEAHVCMTVTNTLPSNTVVIPVAKTLSNGSADPNATHTYSFTIKLERVSDFGSGTVYPESNYEAYSETKTVQVTGSDPTHFEFLIHYAASSFPKTKTTILTYSIKENRPDGEQSTHDAAEYTATVVVTMNNSGFSRAPYVYSLTRNGTAVTDVTFVNTLLGSLSLEKIVDGSDALKESGTFDFTVLIGTDATTPLRNTTLTVYKNGESAGTVNTGTNGTVNLTGVKHGDKIVLKGIPLGCVWRITETDVDGFEVSWIKTDGSGNSNVAEGSIPPGGMELIFTNKSTYVYELPETGGGGTTSYTMAGLALICIGAVYLLYIPALRRRRDGSSL